MDEQRDIFWDGITNRGPKPTENEDKQTENEDDDRAIDKGRIASDQSGS